LSDISLDGWDELAKFTTTPSSGAAVTQTVEYIYDALGRRVGKRVINGETAQDHYRSIPSTGGEAGLQSTTAWRYDGQHIAYEETRDAAGAVTDDRWYSHSDYTDNVLAVTPSVASLSAQGPSSPPASPTAVAACPGAPSDASLYYHADHQGSVRALTDDAGAIINECSYTSYGDMELKSVLLHLVKPLNIPNSEWGANTTCKQSRNRLSTCLLSKTSAADDLEISAEFSTLFVKRKAL